VKGRRSNLTPQLQRRICRLLERVHTVATVCASLGISDRSFHTYCERDGAFLAATQRARANGRVRLVDSILTDRDWRGKAWYLERTAPAEFGRRLHCDVRPAGNRMTSTLPSNPWRVLPHKSCCWRECLLSGDAGENFGRYLEHFIS
jgi:hypothetical protein